MIFYRNVIKLTDFVEFYGFIINYNEEYGEHAAKDVANEGTGRTEKLVAE